MGSRTWHWPGVLLGLLLATAGAQADTLRVATLDWAPYVGPDLPVGWDGVLARALAPRPEARFEALSEFWLALQKPLAHPQRVFAPRRLQRGVLALVLLLAGAALLVGLAG